MRGTFSHREMIIWEFHLTIKTNYKQMKDGLKSIFTK
jgi:hypothetical protein